MTSRCTMHSIYFAHWTSTAHIPSLASIACHPHSPAGPSHVIWWTPLTALHLHGTRTNVWKFQVAFCGFSFNSPRYVHRKWFVSLHFYFCLVNAAFTISQIPSDQVADLCKLWRKNWTLNIPKDHPFLELCRYCVKLGTGRDLRENMEKFAKFFSCISNKTQ